MTYWMNGCLGPLSQFVFILRRFGSCEPESCCIFPFSRFLSSHLVFLRPPKNITVNCGDNGANDSGPPRHGVREQTGCLSESSFLATPVIKALKNKEHCECDGLLQVSLLTKCEVNASGPTTPAFNVRFKPKKRTRSKVELREPACPCPLGFASRRLKVHNALAGKR